MIISGGQQRDSAIHIQVSILPQTPLPSRLPHTIGKSSLSYTIGPCWLSILNDISVPLKWSGMKVAQWCLTLCDPMDYTVHGILQVRILEWIAFPFSRASSQPRDWTQVSHIAGRFFTSWATREGPVSLQSHNHIHLHVGLLYPRVLPLQIQPIYIKNIFKNPKKLQKGKLKLCALSTIYHLHCIRNYKKFWDGLKCNHPFASLRGWF